MVCTILSCNIQQEEKACLGGLQMLKHEKLFTEGWERRLKQSSVSKSLCKLLCNPKAENRSLFSSRSSQF